MQRPRTLGELERSGYAPKSVKDELRANLLEKIRSGQELFPGIIGYADTVIPAIENAVLAGHDMIFLGERGQAKTRLMRSLIHLLDDAIPAVSGCEIHDNPFAPVCLRCRNAVDEHKDLTEISWIPRAPRYAEKLATPDVTIADLIGDIDPIKVAEGRHLSDELVIHYGLIARANRGIFSINEIPDLHEKIQVGLFNLLEERDVQIRGYKVFMPLDVYIVATANPEDYTSRGRIITPLKDRFGAQIRTHYPATREQEMRIVRQEMRAFEHDGFCLSLPGFMEEIISEISQTARRTSDINHSSGISVRMTIHNMETVISNAMRRAVRLGENEIAPRITDLAHLPSSMKGKIEWNFTEDAEEDRKITTLIADAVQKVFRQHFPSDHFGPFLKQFSLTDGWEVWETAPARRYLDRLEQVPSLKKQVCAEGGETSPGIAAAAVEFILEGLALRGKITRQVHDQHLQYSTNP